MCVWGGVQESSTFFICTSVSKRRHPRSVQKSVKNDYFFFFKTVKLRGCSVSDSIRGVFSTMEGTVAQADTFFHPE